MAHTRYLHSVSILWLSSLPVPSYFLYLVHDIADTTLQIEMQFHVVIGEYNNVRFRDVGYDLACSLQKRLCRIHISMRSTMYVNMFPYPAGHSVHFTNFGRCTVFCDSLLLFCAFTSLTLLLSVFLPVFYFNFSIGHFIENSHNIKDKCQFTYSSN